jgi:uncharacterized membrane protein
VNAHDLIKTLHILSAAVLFGTGLGTAFFFWRVHRLNDRTGHLAVVRTVVLADWLFTAPAVIVQPLTGAWLVRQAGFQWTELWLVCTYALYAVAGLCWLPVVAIQIRMKRMLEQGGATTIGQPAYRRLFRLWFILGWPAFGGLIVIFFLMVLKPGW